MIDVDANATTALLPEVLDEMMPWLRNNYANPSGAYSMAKRARAAIDQAREQVAGLIGVEPDEIVFTGSGTESVNTALVSLDRLAGAGVAVVSAIEHSAVLKCVETFSRGVRRVAVDGGGRLDLQSFASALDGAAFVSIMAANNETGVIQPLTEAVEQARAHRLPVHSDAVQVVGKLPLDVKNLGVDMLSLSAHKFHGPKGMGALFIRRGLKFEPLLRGGGQESGRRSGTENTAGIVGMGAAADCASAYLRDFGTTAVSVIRDAFEARILSEIADVTINGRCTERLPGTSHVSFGQCDAAGLLILLDEAGVACSAGSACMTGKQQPSHVQLAMGIPELHAKSSLRFAFSRLSTMEEAHAVADAVKKTVEKLRRVQGHSVGPVVVYSS